VDERMSAEKLSLREVAHRAGLSPSFLSRVLAGERGLPPNDVLLDLAKALGVRPPVMLLLQAGRIPTRSLGQYTDSEMEMILKAVEQLMRGHHRRNSKARG
jgi:transcriptional regulator with XRE-family HTH domain